MSTKTEAQLADELVEFRARWRTEVAEHRTHPPPPAAGPSTAPAKAAKPNEPTSPSTSTSHLSPPSIHAKALSPGGRAHPHLPGPSSSSHHSSAAPPPETALSIYARAAEHEAAGQLGEAVKLYSRAFRMEDQIDHIYNRLRRRAEQAHLTPAHLAPAASSSSQATPSASSAPPEQHPDQPITTTTIAASIPGPTDEPAPYVFKAEYQRGPEFDTVAVPSYDPTAELEESFAHLGVHFVEEEEGKGVILNTLPNEVLVVVLRKLGQAGDWASIARFGSVCKKAFLLSKDQGLWKEICSLTFVPPFQIEPETSYTSLARSAHDGDYREMFVRQPRVRLDGIYISVCHYLRQGVSENSWYEAIHLITYHRLLRFYADGTVISLLSTEHPSILVPLMNRDLRMKGLHHGYWQVNVPDSLSTSSSSSDNDGQPAKPKGPEIEISSLVEPETAESEALKYTFQMTLSLGGTTRGRWNKLDLKEYQSLNLATGEELDIRLFNQKAFFFSKVRSFPTFG